MLHIKISNTNTKICQRLSKDLTSLFKFLFLKAFKILDEEVFCSKLINYSLISYFTIESQFKIKSYLSTYAIGIDLIKKICEDDDRETKTSFLIA